MAFGTWRSGSTTELRNGLRRLREDLGKASYRAEITETAVTVNRTADYWFKFQNGNGGDDQAPIRYSESVALARGGGRTTLWTWRICQTGRPDRPVVIEAALIADGQKLLFSKKAVEGTPDPVDLYAEKAIMNDVTNIDYTIVHSDASKNEGWTAELKVRTQFPNAPKGKEVFLEQSLSAKLEVQAQPL